MLAAYGAIRAYALALASGSVAFTILLAVAGHDSPGSWLLGGLGLFLTFMWWGAQCSPIFILGVVIARRNGWPRPILDVAIGALVAPGASLFALASYARDSLIDFEQVALTFVGAMMGSLYWLLAGRPRPPYPSGQPPAGQSRDM